MAVLALGLWLVCGRSAVKEAVYPAENGRTWLARALAPRLDGLLHGARAAAENQRLRRELDYLAMTREDMRRVAAENARLRSMLGLEARDQGLTTNGWLCAPVLSRNGAGGVRGLIRVGRGSAHGVRAGAAVAVPAGLVGRVEHVSPRTADVRLITDPSVKVSCLIATGDPDLEYVGGILEGGGAHAVHAEAGASVLFVIDPLHVRHLKRRPRLPARAKIITSGLGGVYPRGLTAGFLIDGQDVDESQLEREGDVIPAVDFSQLEDVFIRRED